jgi:hypothetical protein
LRGLARLAFQACSLWDRVFDVMDNRNVPGPAPKRRLTPPTLWGRYVLAPSFEESTDDAYRHGPQARVD